MFFDFIETINRVLLPQRVGNSQRGWEIHRQGRESLERVRNS